MGLYRNKLFKSERSSFVWKTIENGRASLYYYQLLVWFIAHCFQLTRKMDIFHLTHSTIVFIPHALLIADFHIVYIRAIYAAHGIILKTSILLSKKYHESSHKGGVCTIWSFAKFDHQHCNFSDLLMFNHRYSQVRTIKLDIYRFPWECQNWLLFIHTWVIAIVISDRQRHAEYYCWNHCFVEKWYFCPVCLGA